MNHPDDDLTATGQHVITGDVHNEHFDAWSAAWGHVRDINDPVGDTRLYAYEHMVGQEEYREVIPALGACYGFVQCGRVHVSDPDVDWFLRRGQWFVTPGSCRLDFDPSSEHTRVVVAQRVGFKALSQAGGPIEARGRVRYIDSCSDTLLACPPILGDPCLNLLHFPPGIEQTFHTHPSVRAGVVARGSGFCETPHGRTPLRAGLFFSIPAGGEHRFITRTDAMDVIAYHPDSDWGPTDDDHPMLNRTLGIDTGKPLDHDPRAQVESGITGGC